MGVGEPKTHSETRLPSLPDTVLEEAQMELANLLLPFVKSEPVFHPCCSQATPCYSIYAFEFHSIPLPSISFRNVPEISGPGCSAKNQRSLLPCFLLKMYSGKPENTTDRESIYASNGLNLVTSKESLIEEIRKDGC